MNKTIRTALALAMATTGLTASAALDPVSVYPENGALTPGTLIEVEYAEDITWADGYDEYDNDIMLLSQDPEIFGMVYLAYDGSTYIQGNKLFISFVDVYDDELKDIKDWRLYIPMNTVASVATGETNDDFFIDYFAPVYDIVPTSIEPQGLLKVGDDIVITYPVDIAWKSEWAYCYVYFYGLNDPDEEWDQIYDESCFEINGNVLTIHWPGSDWIYSDVIEIDIPKGALYDVNRPNHGTDRFTHIFSDTPVQEEITFSFVDKTYDANEIEEFQQPIQVQVNPADAEYTGSTSTDEDADVDSVGQVVWTGLSGETATYPVFFTQSKTTGIWNMNIYLMAVNEKTPGTYVLTVNAGAFKSGDVESQEFTHIWTIAEKGDQPGDEDIEPQMILPYGEEQEAPFTSIQIAFPYNDGAVTYDNSNPITLVQDATKALMDIEVSTNYNMVKISMEINTNGSYTLTVPAGALRNDKGKNVEIVQSWTVINGEETGIDALDAEQGNVRYYNLQGVEVAGPAEGQLLIRIVDGKARKIQF